MVNFLLHSEINIGVLVVNEIEGKVGILLLVKKARPAIKCALKQEIGFDLR